MTDASKASVRGSAKRLNSMGIPASLEHASDDHLAKAKLILRQSKARELLPGPRRLFADPAVTLLLDLYVARVEQSRVSISSATIATGLPSTSALNLMKTLVEEDLIERRPDADDKRRSWVSLTGKGWDATRHYLAAV